MNKKQRRVILLGFVVILLMGLFPPWLMTSEACLDYSPWRIVTVVTGDPDSVPSSGMVGTRCISYQRHAGWRFLFLARKKEVTSGSRYDGAKVLLSKHKGYHPCRVDTSLLLVQWFLVSAVTGIIVMYLGDRPQSAAETPAE